MSSAAIDFCRYAQRRHSGQTQLARDCYFLRSCLCALLAIFLVARCPHRQLEGLSASRGNQRSDLGSGCRCAACILDHAGDTPVGRFLLRPLLAPVRSLLRRANPVRIHRISHTFGSLLLQASLLSDDRGCVYSRRRTGLAWIPAGQPQTARQSPWLSLVALMWEAWHFTSHLKGTLT